jgi:hypothetical protein
VSIIEIVDVVVQVVVLNDVVSVVVDALDVVAFNQVVVLIVLSQVLLLKIFSHSSNLIILLQLL